MLKSGPIKKQWQIRPATLADLPAVHQQMQQLAAFEGYLTDFRVTVADLAARGFNSAPQFDLLVACNLQQLCGYAVLVYQPFSYDLTPVATLKELYIEAEYRGSGAGQALFQAAEQMARNKGAKRLNWLVLKHNLPAQQFYQQQGGYPSNDWIGFEKNLSPAGFAEHQQPEQPSLPKKYAINCQR